MSNPNDPKPTADGGSIEPLVRRRRCVLCKSGKWKLTSLGLCKDCHSGILNMKTNEHPKTEREPGSLQRRVSRFPRRPGPGWKHMAGSVWEHATGLRIHMLGFARLPKGQSVSWKWEDEYDARRQQGYNTKRALMVWALSLSANEKLTQDARP